MLRSTQDVETNVDVDFDDHEIDQVNERWLQYFIEKHLH